MYVDTLYVNSQNFFKSVSYVLTLTVWKNMVPPSSSLKQFVRTKPTVLFYYKNNMQGHSLKTKDGD